MTAEPTKEEDEKMARVPPYPYRVIVWKKSRSPFTQLEQHNYSSLPGAWTHRDIALRRPNTRKVEITMVIDESTP
jgi:hypothetical protein